MGSVGLDFWWHWWEVSRAHQCQIPMNKKPKKERAVKLSVSLKPHHLAFIEANLPIFGTTSGAITRGLDELIQRVAEEPDVYTIKPVLPPKIKR